MNLRIRLRLAQKLPQAVRRALTTATDPRLIALIELKATLKNRMSAKLAQHLSTNMQNKSFRSVSLKQRDKSILKNKKSRKG